LAGCPKKSLAKKVTRLLYGMIPFSKTSRAKGSDIGDSL